MNLNKVIIAGRLTQAPEQRTTPNGHTVASFSVATNRVWNNQQGQKQEEVEFHNVVVWGRLAEIAGQYLSKGQLIIVEGRLQTRSWDDQQSGTKKYRTEIIGENFQMGPRVNQGNQRESAPAPAEPSAPTAPAEPVIQVDEPVETSAKPSQSDTEPETDNDIKVEDIPF